MKNSKNGKRISKTPITEEEYLIREREISALLNAIETVLRSEEFSATARQVFISCAEIIGAKAGYVALLSDDGSENELLFLEDGGMRCNVDPELPMPIRGLREQAYRTGQVVYDNNFMKSEWIKYMPKGHMALRNVLFSPLNIDNKTVGLMGFACKDGDFTEIDARMAAAFGNYAAIALQNSRTLEELIASNKTKDKLFSIVAHDLKAPFSALLGFSNLLIREVSQSDNQKIIGYSKMIFNTLNKSYEYLSNLLEWARLQSNQIEFHPTTFNIVDVVEKVQSILLLQAQNKRIDLRHLLPNQMPVFADRNMIEVVMINLVSNAIKYSHFDGKVVITGRQKANSMEIRIMDNGIGIAKENCARLFKVEESFSTPGTNKETGTGLGLVLCKDFIAKHKGIIDVESKPGEGSVFWFTLPDKKESENDTETQGINKQQ